jgi:hypothetical protein
MRMVLIAVLGIPLGQGPGLAVANGQPARHLEKAGGYSFVPPKGWKMYDGGSAAFAKTADETIDKQMKQIKQQLAAAPPGSPQAKALQQALDALQRIQKQTQEMGALAKQAGVEDDFKGFMGSAANGPAPTISFSVANLRNFKKTVDGKAVDSTLADVIALYKQPPPGTTARDNETFHVVAEKKLKTEAGAECVVVVTEIDQKGVRYRHTYYFFDLSAERKFVARCSAAAVYDLDAVFEASLKTLRMEKN